MKAKESLSFNLGLLPPVLPILDSSSNDLEPPDTGGTLEKCSTTAAEDQGPSGEADKCPALQKGSPISKAEAEPPLSPPGESAPDWCWTGSKVCCSV